MKADERLKWMSNSLKVLRVCNPAMCSSCSTLRKRCGDKSEAGGARKTVIHTASSTIEMPLSLLHLFGVGSGPTAVADRYSS